ncbi:MAG: GNAT family N-acetyltransferase [Chitinophagales bacterium]
MEVKKVYPPDFDKVYELLKRFENTSLQIEDFKKLFTVYWPCSVNHCGFMIEDKGKVIAYLGVLFSDRVIDGKPYVFGNLTTMIIDPAFRGQKLTHRLVQHLRDSGEYVLTAITPIPALYNMYKQSGFRDLNDFRKILWRLGTYTKAGNYTEEPGAITAALTGEDARIYGQHAQFGGIHALFKSGGEYAHLIFKKRTSHRRKFLDLRLLNYADRALRALGLKGFLYQPMEIYELLYSSNWPLTAEHLKPIMQSFLSLHQCAGVGVPVWFWDKFSPKWFPASAYYHSRQMVYANNLPDEVIDVLYSEIFVLDL